jgi:prepilin signal peptidase PulO-like enzyme (type II secretory pathway)
MQILFFILLFILGACFGSFLCCQARRLHLKSSKGKNKKLGSRSICLHCGYQLKWYDNIPIFSWLFLRGKCRKCKKKIGIAEILSEFSLSLAFFTLGTTINPITANILEWAIFLVTLILAIFLAFLAIYDGLYGELPTTYLIISIICAIIITCLKEWLVLLVSPFSAENILAPLASVAILGGIYLLLYLFSKGKWVGDGDWLLGTALGFALASPWLSLITLFLANVLACLVMAPVVRKNKRKKIYFGPFMVIAFIITLTFADFFYYAIGQ